MRVVLVNQSDPQSGSQGKMCFSSASLRLVRLRIVRSDVFQTLLDLAAHALASECAVHCNTSVASAACVVQRLLAALSLGSKFDLGKSNFLSHASEHGATLA